MTIKIPKEKWAQFFDDLSKRRFGWETKIEVMNVNVGDQILSNGTPLNGITFEEKSGRSEIQIAVGESPDSHQTHTVVDPTAVSYLGEDENRVGIVEIEEGSNKILIHLMNPMPVYVGYASYQIVAV